ncbi:MAG: response regulator [Bacteroidia bacterium]
MKKKIQIIIADDHTIFAEGLKTLLKTEKGMEVSAVVNNGKELINELQKNSYDLILLDINMPGMDGMEAATIIRKDFPNPNILVLSMYDRNDILRKMTAKGVNGYILKNSDPQELIKAIKITSGGGKYFYKNPEDDAEKKTSRSKFDDTFNTNLSTREKEILKQIAQGKTSNQIADQLFISVFTVDTHRKNIASKLDIHNTADLVKYAIQLGLGD